MFTKTEINILHSALGNWKGPYGDKSKLNKGEKQKVKKALIVADQLIERFAEILNHYHEMENNRPTVFG